MPEIFIHYGENMREMTVALMEKAELASRIPVDAKICIKPNLVVSRPASEGATTHPEIVEGIIVYLQKAGWHDITIAEGSWVGDSTEKAFAACGYHALAEKYGVRLVDTKGDRAVKKSVDGENLLICESIANCDYLINVPVLKGHCQTGLTCCLKNMKGCIPDKEKRRYHSDGLHEPIARLNRALRPDLHVVDSVCGDLTFEEGGNPVQSNRILLGFDPVLLDSYGAHLMGYEPDEIQHLYMARQWGVGSYADENTQIHELGAENRPKALPARSGAVKRLSAMVEEDSACSACYAALIHALHKAGYRGGERIKIGQGFRGIRCGGIGVGNCCSGCDRYAKGCPPTALDILRLLESNC